MRRIRATGAFTAAVLRTLLRDKQALFFMLVLPVVVIVVIGTTFGGQGRIELGVTGAPSSVVAGRLDVALGVADGIELHHYANVDAMATAVRHGAIDAGVVIPADADTALTGSPIVVQLLSSTTDASFLTVQVAVSGAVDEVAGRLTASAFAAGRTGATPSDALAAADATPSTSFAVQAVDVGNGHGRALSDFSLTVPQNLVLFTFINATASAAFLVRTRREGVLRRALSTPTSMATQLTGLTLGWFAVALVQSLIIIVIGAVAFDVGFGDPVAAAALVLVWALVGCGAGLLVGALGANEDRVSALAPVVGIVLGALGGCMVPFEVFPSVMQSIARAVPHTWAMNAWRNLVFDGGGIVDIAGSLAVLAAWAVALIGAATFVVRRSLTR